MPGASGCISRDRAMKPIVFVLALAAVSASAQTVIRNGYIRSDGVYVAPSYATAPNDTKLDNYSTKGNTNPYTGKPGTVDPYKVQELSLIHI